MRAGYRSGSGLLRPERRRRNRRLLAVAVGLVLLAAGTRLLGQAATNLLGRLPWFQVLRIEVTGCSVLTPEAVRDSVPVGEGENLLRVSTSRVADAIRRNARVESVRVTRSPGTLHVRLRERRTFLLVSSGTLLEVDSTGLILPPLPGGRMPDRPVVTGLALSTRRPGSLLTSRRLQGVLRLVRGLEAPDVRLLPEISEIAAADARSVTLRTARDQIPILVDPIQATPASLRALAATLHDLRGRHRTVLGMDARFRGQVVVRCAPDSLRATSGRREKV
ncbi:MAG TPA: FtsQ-type POTRA domain-containing protein [Candidatus Eisenbacteria bacterium]|jgi:cell division protein FtsQ